MAHPLLHLRLDCPSEEGETRRLQHPTTEQGPSLAPKFWTSVMVKPYTIYSACRPAGSSRV